MAEVMKLGTNSSQVIPDLTNLNAGQRALLGVEIERDLIAEGKQRRRDAAIARRQADNGQFGAAPRQPEDKAHKSAVLAADAVNVSRESIRLARKLLAEAPDLAELVRSAELSLAEAADENARRRRLAKVKARSAGDPVAPAAAVTVLGSSDDLIRWLWPPPPALQNLPPVTGSSSEDVSMPGSLRKALAAYSLAELHVISAEDDFRAVIPGIGMLWASHVVAGDAAAAAAASGTLNEKHAAWRAKAVEARHRFDEAVITARASKVRASLQRAADERLGALERHLSDVATEGRNYHDHPAELARDRARAEALRRDLGRAEDLRRWADLMAGLRAESVPPRHLGSGPVGPTIWPLGRLSQKAATGLARLWPPATTPRRD